MPRKAPRSTRQRDLEGVMLEFDAVTRYLDHMRRLQRGSRLRDLKGQFVADAVGMGQVFVRLVQYKLLAQQEEFAELSRSTIQFKRATQGKNELGYVKLVKGNVGRYVNEKLLHTGFYYDSIGFTNSLLAVRNRNTTLQPSGGWYVPGDRKSIVRSKRLAYNKGVVTLDIGLVNGNQKIYKAGSGKRWSLEQIAAFHEFGTVNEPARPVWGPAIEEFNNYMTRAFLDKTFNKTYKLCEDLILGTPSERNDRSGKVRASTFTHPGSFTKALYNASFDSLHNPQKTNKERLESGMEYNDGTWSRVGGF